MSGTVTYLVGQELKRNLRPVRGILIFGLGLAMAYAIVVSQWSQKQLYGALTHHVYRLALLLPFIAGATGSSLAEDRRRGFTVMVLAKGVPRWRYLLAKILGAAASSGLFALLTLLGFYGIAAALWEHGWVEYPAGWSPPGPMPMLYDVNPLAHDLVVAVIYLEASAALPLVSVLAGTLVANDYIAIVAPAIFLILCAVFLGGALQPLDPMLYVERLDAHYVSVIPYALLPYAAHLYWLCFGCLFAGLSYRSFVKRDLS